MIKAPSVYDSGALTTIPPDLKLFSNQIQPEKAEWCGEHPNHIQRELLSFLTVETQFLVKKSRSCKFTKAIAHAYLICSSIACH